MSEKQKLMIVAIKGDDASFLPRGALVCSVNWDAADSRDDQMRKYAYPVATTIFDTLNKDNPRYFSASPQGDGAGE